MCRSSPMAEVTATEVEDDVLTKYSAPTVEEIAARLQNHLMMLRYAPTAEITATTAEITATGHWDDLAKMRSTPTAEVTLTVLQDGPMMEHSAPTAEVAATGCPARPHSCLVLFS